MLRRKSPVIGAAVVTMCFVGTRPKVADDSYDNGEDRWINCETDDDGILCSIRQ